MKALSIKQPWATLIAAGIKDIENRTWAPNYEGRILIHASTTKVPKNIYNKIIFEQSSALSNEQLFGNVPNFEDMPCSAIVGYVTVKGACNDSESIWAEPVDFQWMLEDACLFDEPILGINGKLHLWDYPDIDEDHLPKAHKLVRKAPQMDGDCLIIPLTEDNYNDALNNGNLLMEPTYELADLIEKPDEEVEEGESHLKVIPKIKLVSPSHSQAFAIKSMDYMIYDDGKGNTAQVINWNMEKQDYFNLSITLGEKI